MSIFSLVSAVVSLGVFVGSVGLAPVVSTSVRGGSLGMVVSSGFSRASFLKGLVWNDVNKNGKRDGGERVSVGKQVSLFDKSGKKLLLRTVTGENGVYKFSVKPGVYRVFASLESSEVGLRSGQVSVRGLIWYSLPWVAVKPGVHKPPAFKPVVREDACDTLVRTWRPAWLPVGVKPKCVVSNGDDWLGMVNTYFYSDSYYVPFELKLVRGQLFEDVKAVYAHEAWHYHSFSWSEGKQKEYLKSVGARGWQVGDYWYQASEVWAESATRCSGYATPSSTGYGKLLGGCAIVNKWSGFKFSDPKVFYEYVSESK